MNDASPVVGAEKLKILLYAHFVSGLGHLVRAMRVADAVLQLGDCRCCVVTSYRNVESLRFDPRIEVALLPAVGMDWAGRLSSIGNVDHYSVIGERSRRICKICEDWEPDIVVVDHLPLGLSGELLDTILEARNSKWKTRFVLALEDQTSADAGKLQRPDAKTPRNPRVRRALEHYHGALAYSDPDWIDSFAGTPYFGMPEQRQYVGIVTGQPLPTKLSSEPLIVVLTGAGAGGLDLFDLILRAASVLLKENCVKLRFVVGPEGDHSEIARRASEYRNIEVWSEGRAIDAIKDAWLAVSRAGYDTAYTLVQTEVPTIFVPLPSLWCFGEQFYRARCLSRLPNVWVLEERAHDALESLQARLRTGLEADRVKRHLPFRVTGAANAAGWLRDCIPHRMLTDHAQARVDGR
jgi:predicted glycosyltransferase